MSLETTVKLHIGSGNSALSGWVNLDIADYPGVDAVLDVRQGIPFTDVEFIFAEHFIEHLTLEEGLAFMRECRRILTADGVLRLSTPNLDWVWLTHYRQPEQLLEQDAIMACLEINRAFHGWGHRFLYNLHTLSSALNGSGFCEVIARGYGESTVAELRGLERHEHHADIPGAPSVIIVEASGTKDSSRDFDAVARPYIDDASVR